MKKTRGFVSFGLANVVVFLAIVSCATTNTGEKKLSKKEKIEQLSAEVKGLQQQLVKEGNAGKAYMIDLQKKLIKANAMCDSLYNTPILANAMVEGRLDIGDPFKEITIPAFSYETTPKLLVFPTDLMESKVSYSKSDKIAYLSQLKGSLSESLTADRTKTKSTVQALEKELEERSILISSLQKALANEEKIIAEKKAEQERLRKEKELEERSILISSLQKALANEEKIIAEKKAEQERLRKENERFGEMVDNRDGKVYKQVKIGTQVWMTENLNVDKFRNGDPIPEAKTDEEWRKARINKQPAWCYYNNNPDNGDRYGKLYNWYAVNDPRGLALKGWHVPSDKEWTVLTDYLGGEAGTKMKSKSGWNNNGNGTNESGFSGLPGGGRGFNGTFYYIGSNGYWWSSTEYGTYIAWFRYLNYFSGDVLRLYYDKENGFSVRCLRD